MNEILITSLMFSAPIGIGITLVLLFKNMEKPLYSLWNGFLVMFIATALCFLGQVTLLIKDFNQQEANRRVLAGELWQKTFKGSEIGKATLNHYFSCNDIGVSYIETKCRAATIELLKRDGFSPESVLEVHKKFKTLDTELSKL